MFWAPIYLLKEELAVTAGVLVKGIRIMSWGSWAQGDVGLISTNRGGSQAVHTEITQRRAEHPSSVPSSS